VPRHCYAVPVRCTLSVGFVHPVTADFRVLAFCCCCVLLGLLVQVSSAGCRALQHVLLLLGVRRVLKDAEASTHVIVCCVSVPHLSLHGNAASTAAVDVQTDHHPLSAGPVSAARL